MRLIISQCALWIGVAIFSISAGETILQLVYEQPIDTRRSVVTVVAALGLMFLGLATMLYPQVRVLLMLRIIGYTCICFTGLVLTLGPLKARGLLGLTQKDLSVVLVGVAMCAGGILWGLHWRKQSVVQ